MTAPSSRPDTPAQQHADTAREVVRRLSGTGDVPAIDFALDALLAHVERLTNVLEYTQMRADAQQERAEAAESERDWLREQLDRQTENAAVFLRERDEIRRETAATLARSELAWCIGYASTAEHKAWRERLLKRLHVARAALAEDASHQDAGEPGYGGDGDGAAT